MSYFDVGAASRIDPRAVTRDFKARTESSTSQPRTRTRSETRTSGDVRSHIDPNQPRLVKTTRDHRGGGPTKITHEYASPKPGGANIVVSDPADAKHHAACIKAGVPDAIVPMCAEGLKAGVPIEEVIAQLQQEAGGNGGLTPEQEAAAQQAAASLSSAPRWGRWLLYGGLAAAAGIVIVKRRRKA